MNIGVKNHLEKQDGTKLDEIRQREVDRVLKKWRKFEKFVTKDRKQQNQEYFFARSFDFDNYYKGTTIGQDIKDFNW
jgi:hypothetical protein